MDLQQAIRDITDGISQEQLKEQVTSEHIHKISLEMTKWEDWASALKLTATQVEDIDRENRTMHSKRLTVLRVWKETFGSTATYEKLVDALLKFKMRRMAEFVCSLLKTPSVAIPSQEYDTFLLHYSKVVDAIQDPVPLATRLFDRGVIDHTVLQNATYPGQPSFKNTHMLLSAVRGRIQTDPTTFQVFLSALKEDTSLQSLVESMEGGTGPGVHDEGRPPESRDGGEERSLPATNHVCTEDRISASDVASAHSESTTYMYTRHLTQQHQHHKQSINQPLKNIYLLSTHPYNYPPNQIWNQSPYQPPVQTPYQPPHHPSLQPPPSHLPVGQPSYEHSRHICPLYYQTTHTLSQPPPVQSPQPRTCIYQPPHQPPQYSSYQPAIEPIHMYPPSSQPSHYPHHPPPYQLAMGPPSSEHGSSFQRHHYQPSHQPLPIQSPHPPVSAYQPPCQPPQYSPHRPPVEPIHEYPPPHQPTRQPPYHPSSQLTPHSDTPLGKYALFLRECYTLHKAPSTKWPYLDVQNYVNLAVISSEYANREELNTFRQQTIHGCVDDILEWKAPIAMSDILKPNYVYDFVKGKATKYPVTQLLIEGAPGIGKSTFAWEVCQRWGENELFQEYSLVVLLKLRDKRVQEARRVSDLFYHPHSQLQSEIVNDIIFTRGHGLLLILEGFDEAPVSKQTMDSIFVRLFTGQELPKATVILTTRPSASAELRQLCYGVNSRRVEVVGFGKKEIDKCVQCAFSGKQTILTSFSEYLKLYPHIHSMMYVPLNCIIVTHVYQQCHSTGEVAPKTMTQLYSSLIRSQLLRYLRDEEDYRYICKSICGFKDLPQPVYTQFLDICKLAYTGIMRSETELIFQDLPSDFDPLGLMQTCPELYVDSGASLSYNFLHLTIQEYLAAYYISQQSREEQVAFMREHIANKKLEVVVRLLAGFSLSELGQHLWEVVREFASEHIPSQSRLSQCGENKSVKLEILHWLFECQDHSSIHHILGSNPVVCFGHHKLDTELLPFDWYVLGYCITHSSCDWKLELRCSKLESVKAFLNSPTLQQDKFLLPSKGKIKQMVLWHSDTTVLHLLVTNMLQMSMFHHLTHLSLCESLLTSRICDLLSEHTDLLQHLLHLEFFENPFIGRGGAMNLITSLTKFSTIRELHLANSGIGFEDCKALSELLTSSKYIERLNIGCNNRLFSDSIQLIVDGLSCNTSLETLFMSESHFSSENVLSLASVLRVNTRLKELNVEYCNIQSSDSVHLAKALEKNTATQLQTLRLSDNPIGSEGAVAFAGMLATNESLTHLNMNSCSIGREGALACSSMLKRNQCLKTLRLCDGSVDVEGATNLIESLKHNRTLEELWLSCKCEPPSFSTLGSELKERVEFSEVMS